MTWSAAMCASLTFGDADSPRSCRVRGCPPWPPAKVVYSCPRRRAHLHQWHLPILWTLDFQNLLQCIFWEMHVEGNANSRRKRTKERSGNLIRQMRQRVNETKSKGKFYNRYMPLPIVLILAGWNFFLQGDKVKHTSVVSVIVSWGPIHIPHISLNRHNRRWCTFFSAGVPFSTENGEGPFLKSLFREYNTQNTIHTKQKTKYAN